MRIQPALRFVLLSTGASLGASLGSVMVFPLAALASPTDPPVTQVAGNANHTCAAIGGVVVRCWGLGGNGELGNGTQGAGVQQLTPVDASGLSGVTDIATGASHACASTTGGGLKCWGLNANGQLGDGTTTQRSTPVDVFGLAGGDPNPTAAPTVTAPLNGQTAVVTGVTFRWTGNPGAAGYSLGVTEAVTGAVVFSGSLLGAASTSILINLPAGNYSFAVRACSLGLLPSQCGAAGTVSFAVNPAGPAGVPTITSPNQGTGFTSSTQTLAWTAVTPNPALSGLGYEVLLKDLAAGATALQITVPSPAVSTIFTMKSSSQYELKVRACQAGCGPWSAPVTFSVTLPPVPAAAPASLACTVNGGSSLTCSWAGASNADAYQVRVVQPSPAGPGGGALTVAARQVSDTAATLPVPPGGATVLVAACNGNGCGPDATVPIMVTGTNPAEPNIGTPMAGTVVSGPTVLFTWNRVPGDDGVNTRYRLFVQDLARQAAALDVYTRDNFYAAYFKAEGARYDALVVARPGTPSEVAGPAIGFNVSGASAQAPTMTQPTHQGRVDIGNIQIGWSPVSGAWLYEYFVAVAGEGEGTVRGVTTGLFVQAPLGLQGGTYPIYSAVVRACPAGAMCVAGSDQGWGPWSHQGGPGVTNFGLNCPVPIGVLPGEETYFISGNFPNGTPALTRLNLRPFFPYPGESQLLTVDAYVKASTGDDPITQVTYQYLVSDAPAQPVGDMQLKSGTAFNGTWAARFTPPDLVCNGRSNLQLPIVPTNRNGASPITLSFR